MLFFVFSLSHTEKVWLPFDISQEWQIDILNKKNPGLFIYSAGIFYQLFRGLLHYPFLNITHFRVKVLYFKLRLYRIGVRIKGKQKFNKSFLYFAIREA